MRRITLSASVIYPRCNAARC
ncbi:hypothetical protein TSAR_006017 [Trichomalopsis sarcophagae]|uniref:Uncharacterized protein n=1 Tax=Trichomalopsis sarcophagae TaxID=543379 RepID=A0A232EEN6_9HYME|nr:hypothetical protein TSAR_006017 [Trichomalopsis sarcophagae]